MKPVGNEYKDDVIVPKVWEEIDGFNHLVTKEVSDYIRKLEAEVKDLKDRFDYLIKTKR